MEDRILELCKTVGDENLRIDCSKIQSCDGCIFHKKNSAGCFLTREYRFNKGLEIAQQYIKDHTLNHDKEGKITFTWEDFKNGKISVHCDTEEKAKDFINKAIKEGCYWFDRSNKTNFCFYKEKTVYSSFGRNGHLGYGTKLSAPKKIINWQIKEDNKMEKTFREVIADIKEGEVWESNEKIIRINNCNQIVIEVKEGFEGAIAGNERMALDINRKYKLQRKQYTFEEAFKAYEKGKEIESCVSSRVYSLKKASDLFSANEIRGKWYINHISFK